MKSIVIIFPYFGKLPVQYKMWRESALRNPSVDFMFFTDADVEMNAAFRVNMDAFKNKLRQIGFYTDMSDACILQKIRPRYKLED